MKKKYSEAELKELAKSIPYAKEGEFIPGKLIAVGWKQFEEYMAKRGRPKKDDATEVLAVRVPASVKAKLKSHGAGAIKKAGEYLAEGIRSGAVFL